MRGEPLSPAPKPQPRLLAKRAKQAELAALGKAESAKARQRAAGRCEVREAYRTAGSIVGDLSLWHPCWRRDVETHHLIGGSGRRNRGLSILASRKLRVCREHYRDITGHVLVPMDPQAEATAVVYNRRVPCIRTKGSE